MEDQSRKEQDKTREEIQAAERAESKSDQNMKQGVDGAWGPRWPAGARKNMPRGHGAR